MIWGKKNSFLIANITYTSPSPNSLAHLLDGVAGLDLAGLLVLLAVREDHAVRLVGRPRLQEREIHI